MAKRIASIVVAVILMFTGSISVFAENNTVQPRYSYTSNTSVNIYISNGSADCSAQLVGYGSVTKIRITMTLQKKGLLWWNEVDTWTTTYYDTYAIMSKSCSVGSGKYRTKAEFTVYAGSNSEDITSYSLEQTV